MLNVILYQLKVRRIDKTAVSPARVRLRMLSQLLPQSGLDHCWIQLSSRFHPETSQPCNFTTISWCIQLLPNCCPGPPPFATPLHIPSWHLRSFNRPPIQWCTSLHPFMTHHRLSCVRPTICQRLLTLKAHSMMRTVITKNLTWTWMTEHQLDPVYLLLPGQMIPTLLHPHPFSIRQYWHHRRRFSQPHQSLWSLPESICHIPL